MNELKNLSEEKINLKNEVDMKNHINVFHMLEKQLWDDCPVCFIENSCDWTYFKLHLNHGRVIPCEKGRSCELRKIKNGIFAGNYCIIEKTSNFKDVTRLSVLHKDGILRYPEFGKDLSLREIDGVLDRKFVVGLIAEMMSHHDITAKYQRFELFCDGLPKSCWKQGEFAADILHEFNLGVGIKLEKNVDPNLVRLGRCMDKVKKTILNYSIKNKDERVK